MSDNLALWNSVCVTDPKYTKAFNRGGGFKGTSTNATYLARKATERWGPIGIGWGVEVIDEELMQGVPLQVGDAATHETIHKVRVKLWYKQDGCTGEVFHFGQTTFIGRNKNGLFTDEEAPKKSLTDAMAKCLSLLGFSADIFLGLYDDNKYVNDLRQKFANGKTPAPAGKPNGNPPRGKWGSDGNARGTGTQGTKMTQEQIIEWLEVDIPKCTGFDALRERAAKVAEVITDELKRGELQNQINVRMHAIVEPEIAKADAKRLEEITEWWAGRVIDSARAKDIIEWTADRNEQLAAPAT